MFGIGAFARLAQVSARTLRYYDELCLLRPAEVDPANGYRWYTAEQLHRLNRILALRDLGLPLDEIQRVVEDQISLDELRGMLRLRQSEARERIAEESARLMRVEARLRQIEQEGRVSDYDVVVKAVEPQRVALLRENVPAFGHDTLGPVLGRLYGRLHGELARLGISPAGPDIALYEESGDPQQPVTAIAAAPIGDANPSSPHTFEIVDLRDVPRAATTIHRGEMRFIQRGYEALMHWADTAGERIDGYSREVYLQSSGLQETWVTELQFALGSPLGG